MEDTEKFETPMLFRLWAAISVIAAVTEQKTWMISQGQRVFPNIYCGLIAHAGVGKTKIIHHARDYYSEIPEPLSAPTSLTPAAMVDALAKRKRSMLHIPEGKIEYNTMYITADELTAFMHKYDQEGMGFMSHCYDAKPYGHERRTNELKIKIASPQINMIVGATPSVLVSYMPQNAWEQGFCSRIIFVFSDERIIGDDFAEVTVGLNKDLVHDLLAISGLVGEFEVTPGYREAITNWRQLGEPPVPTHPKLLHYCTRRRMHLYKLSMVSALDRSDVLLLTVADFNRALTWLTEAEATMPDIFKAGAGNADAQAMDEIYHYALVEGAKPNYRGAGIPERKIMNFARELLPMYSLDRVLKHMENAGLLVPTTGADYKTGQRRWRAAAPQIEPPDGDLN